MTASSVNDTISNYHDHEEHFVGDMIYLCCILVIGTAGNSLIFFAVAKSSQLRKLSNSFICSIAAADLIVCAYYVPTMIASRVTHVNVYGEVGCIVNGIILAVCMGVSNFSFMFIAINRYMFVLHKALYRRIFTRKGVIISIFMIWLFWILYSIGILYFQGFGYEDDAYMCMFSDEISNLYVSALLTTLSVGLPSLTALICYVAMCVQIFIISRTAGGSSDTKTRFKREGKAILSVFVAYLIFNVCWGPYTLHIYLTKAGIEMSEKEMYWLCITNSVLNSLIYGLFNGNFRRGYAIAFGLISNRVDTHFGTNSTAHPVG